MHKIFRGRFAQIAYLSIVALIVGSVAGPLLHAVLHFHEASHAEATVKHHHEYPSHVALFDNTHHMLDTEIECVLCNQSTTHYTGVPCDASDCVAESQYSYRSEASAANGILISKSGRAPPVALHTA